MTLVAVFALMVAIGAVLGVASVLVLRRIGARPAVARRLAGPREVKVGDLVGDEALPDRPVRVAGRIRCRDPLDAGDGERLVAYHRDVEVRAGGSWRRIERIRETRSFELWDHNGSVTIDPADASEPLITIPKVWRGSADELQEPHAAAAARLRERHGALSGARSVVRTINVTDRLLVLARPARAEGRLRLEPPPGGYLVTNVELDDAMRLLGGRNRRAAAASVVALAAALALVAIGSAGTLVVALLG